MKRVTIKEKQYKAFLNLFKGEEVSSTPVQDISNMRQNIADLKISELKFIARDAINIGFMLGCGYASTSELDFELRKQILQKLNELVENIDEIK